MEPRRCGVHGLVLGEDGRCVICRRGEVPEVQKTSSDWPVVVFVLVVGVLLLGGLGYGLSIRLKSAAATPPPESAPVLTAEAPPEVTNAQPGPAPRPKRTDLPDEPKPEPTAAPQELTPEALAAAKRKVRVTMYVAPRCPLCDRARLFLKQQGVQLTELDIEASATDKVLLQAVNPAATVPTFDVEGKVLVGYERVVLEQAVEETARARAKR